MTEETNTAGEGSTSTPEPLRLDQFLKLHSLAETGGRAKLMIQNGEVKVNGATETRRRRNCAWAT